MRQQKAAPRPRPHSHEGSHSLNPGGLDPFGLEIFELEGRWEAHTRMMGEPLAKFSTTTDKLTHQSVDSKEGSSWGRGGPRIHLVETETEGRTNSP